VPHWFTEQLQDSIIDNTSPRSQVASVASHFTRRVVGLLVPPGRAVDAPGGLPMKSDFALAVPFGYEPVLQDSPRIGAVVHIFYPEFAAEFAEALRHLGPDAQVMITTDTAEKRAAILEAFAGWPEDAVAVRLVANRGRDIAPKLTAFTHRYSEFDLLLFMHSKLAGSKAGQDWRENLIAGLIGSEAVVRSIRAIFEAEPRTGMVYCQHHEAARRWTGWQKNFGTARKLATHWDLRLKRLGEIDFPSGSMFWARPAALKPILRLGLSTDDFPEEPIKIDGTLAHAIERLFALGTEQAGYTWFKVAAPQWYTHREAIITPHSDFELRRFISSNERCLTRTMAVSPASSTE
jgi:lipopolysaccharide biosynthesis protein